MYFLKNKVFTYFLLILAVIVGTRSMMNTPRELYPEIKIPTVIVSTVYPGASAKDVEESITEKLEDALIGGLKNVDTLSSSSREGVSVISIQFEDNANITESLVDVQDKVNEKKNELPDDATEPLVKKVNFSDAPIFTFALSSSDAFTRLRNEAEEIKKSILSVSGVSDVVISGIEEREITILLSPEKLSQHGISAGQVMAALRNAEKTFPAGSFVLDDRHYRISYDTKIHSAEDLSHVVVASRSSGNIYVSDLVVRIEDGLATDTRLARIGKSGGEVSQQAVIFDVKKQSGGNIMELTASIKERLEAYKAKSLDGNTDLVVVFDAGKDIEQNLDDLVGSGFQTIILILVVMGFMVGLRDSVIAALSVPLSFLLAFLGMSLFGITINFITLFSLILVIGILIDSAVVIVEGINRGMTEGKQFFDAAGDTLQEYSKPVLAGVLTTISIFIPLMTLSGMLGQFIGGIPRVIIIVLIMSLVVALVFVPAIAGLVYSLRIKEPKYVVKKRESFFKKITVWYRKMLSALIQNSRHKYIIVISLIVLFISSFMLVGFGFIKSEFFTAEELDQTYLNIELAQGTSLKKTSLAAKKVDTLVKQQAHVVATTTTIGSESGFVGSGRSGTHYANITINIDDKKNGRMVTEKIRQELSREIKDFSVQVLEPESGPPVGAPFQVELTGADWDSINRAAEQVATFVESLPAARNVKSGVDVGSTEIKLEILHDRLIEYGLSAVDISSRVRTALYGSEAITLNPDGSGEVPVVVKIALNPNLKSHKESNIIDFDQIKNMPIRTAQGEMLLGYFVKERLVQSTSVAQHKNGKKIKTVTSYIKEGFLPVDLVNEFNKLKDTLDLPADITLKLAGSDDESNKASSELGASLGIGMLLIIAVLVWQFGSFRSVFFILSVVPLGLIGVLYGLFFTGITLSFTAMLGFIALVGVVVNNSIILIDVMNTLRKSNVNMSTADVALEGATARLRPILLTTATTVLGMIPLLTVSPMWKPFALAMITGLSFATVLTLVLIPLFYAKWGK